MGRPGADTAATWLIGHRLRSGWGRIGLLALLVAVGATATLVALGASVRTSGAYSRYLRDAEVGDVVINPSLPSTTDSDALLRSLPGLRAISHDAMFLATLDDGAPRTVEEFQATETAVLVRGSNDGRHLVMDRPALERGRLASGNREAVITVELADDLRLDVGDRLTVAFWPGSIDVGGAPEGVVQPAGVEDLTVVGVGTLPDEVLPDNLYPRGQVIVSPDVADRYDCLGTMPGPDAEYVDVVSAVLPAGCATSYPYYSLDVAGGDAGRDRALQAFGAGVAKLNERLPTALLDVGASYALIATTSSDTQAQVERSVQPVATTLSVLALGAALVTVVVLGFAVARDLRRSEDDQVQWWRLGLGTQGRLRVLLVPHLIALAIGFAAALVGAWLLSPIAPVGTVRSIDPSPARELSRWVLLGALALAAFCVGGAAVLALRSVRRVAPRPVRPREPGLARRLARTSAQPEVVEGIRAAFGGNRGAGLVIASGAVAVGVLLTAVVFGASLSATVSRPASFGWPWDVAMLGGSGYGSQDLDAMTETLEHRSDVERWTALAFGSFRVDDQQVVAMVPLGPPADQQLTLVSGALPSGGRQVALGTKTAADLGVGVGDEVRLAGDPLEERTARVSGLIVLPALGPYQADRASPGVGMVLPAGALPDGYLRDLVTFVGIDLAPERDRSEFLLDLHDGFVAWSLADDPPIELPAALRPPEIIDAASMRAAPLLLGGSLALAAAAGLSLAVAVSVRARRRELGTLRALGLTGRQLRNSVRVQAVATTAAALALGIPLGIVGGRLAWRAYALQLGVVPSPTIPFGWVAGTILGALAVSVVTAAVPARAAARAHPASILGAD